MSANLRSEKLTVLTSRVLRYGVLASCVLISLGTALNLGGLGSGAPCPTTLEDVCSSGYGNPSRDPQGMLAGITNLNFLSVVQLGVVLLLTLPFFRIAASLATYVSEKDKFFIVISSFILAILLFSALVVGPMEASG